MICMDVLHQWNMETDIPYGKAYIEVLQRQPDPTEFYQEYIPEMSLFDEAQLDEISLFNQHTQIVMKDRL